VAQTIICTWRESMERIMHHRQLFVFGENLNTNNKLLLAYTVFVLPNLYFIEDDLRY
jgi:hypothetical protein